MHCMLSDRRFVASLTAYFDVAAAWRDWGSRSAEKIGAAFSVEDVALQRIHSETLNALENLQKEEAQIRKKLEQVL